MNRETKGYRRGLYQHIGIESRKRDYKNEKEGEKEKK
jgi:hypothetical protein